MKLAIITESWPTLGIDSIYLNKAFIEIANTVDISIYTTSQNGYGTITGQNNILIHRLESVPHRACSFFMDRVANALKSDSPDIVYNITLNHDLNITAKKKIMHWVTGSSVLIDQKTPGDYDTHVTLDATCQSSLIAAGIEKSKLVFATPSTVCNIIKQTILQ